MPTTGQRASSISWALGSLTADLRAGQDVAVEEVLEAGIEGCVCRLWWWSVVAPTTGQVWPSLERSIEGWLGGRTSLVVPITGQAIFAVVRDTQEVLLLVLKKCLSVNVWNSKSS